MIQKRYSLTGATALLVAMAAPGSAQQADTGATEEQADQPVQRRFLMEDTYGTIVTNEDLHGYFTLIYFGYTTCPDVCPSTLAVVADAVETLEPDQKERTKILFVTVDPNRDTPKVLRDYVGYFGDHLTALRGPKAYTDHMVKAFNARYEFHVPDPEEPEFYVVDHTASVAFLGPDGTLIKRFPHGTPTDAMSKDLREIIESAMQE